MRWLLGLGLLSIVFLAFVGGLAAAFLDLPPAPAARAVLEELRAARANWRSILARAPSYLLEPAVYEGEGVVVSEPDRMQPGVTLLTGLFGNRLGFRMVDAEGNVLHDWPVDFFQIAPEEMEHRFHALIHGTVLYPNGDIVANLDARGMVRVDRCGTILWHNRVPVHHSIDLDDAGGLWAPALADPVENPDLTPGTFAMDDLVRIDPETGEVTERISEIEMLDASDRLGVARPGVERDRMDIIHTNDVEPLPAAIADAFQMFAAGDLLVSSRNLHQLWVLDGRTHLMKWMFVGPTEGQHDADFQPDGTITVLDNLGRSGPAGRRASRILSIDPATGESRTLFRGSPEAPFYTWRRGKHQVLENGNVLIAETDRGRAFEVTPEGEVVWSYVNRWDEDEVGWMMQADRYPASYATNGDGCG